MIKLDLNFDKKDIELEINGKVYGFDLTEEKTAKMAALEGVAKNISDENEDEILYSIEDAIDMIYGDGTIDDIFGERETTRATLLEILFATIEAIESYGAKFGLAIEKEETKEEIVQLNRAQRRSNRRRKK